MTSASSRERSPVAPWLATAGYLIAVGWFVHRQGLQDWPMLLTLLGLIIVAVMMRPAARPPFPQNMEKSVYGILLFLGVLSTTLELSGLMNGWSPQVQLGMFLLVAVVVSAESMAFGFRKKLDGVLIVLIAVGHLTLGWAVVHNHPTPRIDVWYFNTVAAEALLAGENPYDTTIPNIYTQGETDRFYSPDVVSGGRVQVGYPYPPAPLLAVTPGRLLGDVRYGLVGATVATGVLLMLGFRSKDPRLGILFLHLPGTLFVLEQSWMEPVSALSMALALVLWSKRSVWFPLALGFFLSTKQYLWPYVPFVLLVMPMRGSHLEKAKWLSKVAAGGLATLVPFALWNLERFRFSVVEVQFIQPFREDAFSLLSMLVRSTGWPPLEFAAVPTILAIGVALAFGLRVRRDAIGLAGAIAFGTLLLFVVSKQAFANYFWFAGSAALITAAVAGEGARAMVSEPASDASDSRRVTAQERI